MANVKISALTSASTPLAGTEVLPIVQSSATVKVAVSDLTAGRAVSASSFAAPTIGAASGAALSLQSNGTTNAILDSSGNLGLGVTPATWFSGYKVMQISSGVSLSGRTGELTWMQLMSNAYRDTAGDYRYIATSAAAQYRQQDNTHQWYTAASGTAGNVISFSEGMRLDASGNLLVGTTSGQNSRLVVDSTNSADSALWGRTNTSTTTVRVSWNSATSGDNIFDKFFVGSGPSQVGSISFNRAGGITVYSTTSDYRSKDIIGPVTDSGALIDSTPVYMGKMKGATQARPMFIAHETPSYAHTGEKDAVDKDGNPVYQQMDASALIPVMWAEIQSLRQRLAAANL